MGLIGGFLGHLYIGQEKRAPLNRHANGIDERRSGHYRYRDHGHMLCPARAPKGVMAELTRS